MLITVYSVLFLISVFFLLILMLIFKNRINPFYVLLYCTIIVTNFGYMQMARAQNVTLAVNANQILYLGASYTSFCMILCLADLCKITLHRSLIYFFVILATACFIFSCSTNYTHLYYKSVYMVSNHGVHLLKKKYGPLHIIYPIYIISANLVGFLIIVRSFFKRKNVPYATSVSLMITMLISIVFYIIEKESSVGIPLVPVGNNISAIFVFLLLLRIRKYDISSFTSDFIQESRMTGFLSFDHKGRFLGDDGKVSNWFPEVNNLRVDYRIQDEETDLLKQIGRWIRGEETTDTVVLSRGRNVIEIKHSILKKKSTGVIHCFFFRDDTIQANYNERLKAEVAKQTRQIKDIQADVNLSMANIVENRDNNTGGHIVRTSDVVKIFVNHLMEKGEYTATQDYFENIIKAAPLHDFGKIAIPDAILNKPGKFTADEYEQMKLHPAKGAVLVEQLLNNVEEPQFRSIAINVAHYHHEKWDGTGYPEKISGQKIPFEARIMALADVFDALVSKRVYKEEFSYEKAFSIIEESAGSHFDPSLAKSFLECREELETLYDNFKAKGSA